MNGEMSFSLRDLYPNLYTQSEDTGTKANPDYEDQEVFNENSAAEKTDKTNASRKNVFIAIIIFIALVVLFGSK